LSNPTDYLKQSPIYFQTCQVRRLLSSFLLQLIPARQTKKHWWTDPSTANEETLVCNGRIAQAASILKTLILCHHHNSETVSLSLSALALCQRWSDAMWTPTHASLSGKARGPAMLVRPFTWASGALACPFNGKGYRCYSIGYTVTNSAITLLKLLD
jgi:hypothetical protein